MNWYSDLMQQRLVLVLAHFVWQGLLLAVMVAGLLAGMRRARPGLRYAVSLAAFGLLMVAPVITWFVLTDGSAMGRDPVGSRQPLSARDSVEVENQTANTEPDLNDVVTRRVPFGVRNADVDPEPELDLLVSERAESELSSHSTENRVPQLDRLRSSDSLALTVNSGRATDRPGTSTSSRTADEDAREGTGADEWLQAGVSGGASMLEWVAPYRHWIIGGWLVGVLLLSVRLILGVVGTAKWRRESDLLPESQRSTIDRLCERLCGRMRMRVPLVRTSQRVSEAVVLGLIKPMVLLPIAWVVELPPDMLEAVIAHELAHLRRFDLGVNLVQRVVETLLFYHPAVWWLSRRIRIEREKCCDELAVQVTDDRVGYASALEHVARLRLSQQAAAPLALAMTGRRRGLLLDRVQSLLNGDTHESASTRRVAGIVTLAVAALLVGVAWFGAELAGQVQRGSLRAGKATQKAIELGGTTTPAERGFGPELRMRASDGSPAVFNHVVTARVGYPLDSKGTRPWLGFRDRHGVISLKDAPQGERLLLVAPSFGNRTLIRATLPPKEFVIERRMRELTPWAPSVRVGPRSTRDSQSFDARVETADDRTETIVLTAINHHTDPLVIHPEDICLTDATSNHRVLSPQLIARLNHGATSDDDIVVPPGKSVEIPIKWNEWIRHGIWASRSGEAIDEPWSVLSAGGKWQVRVNVRNTGTLPVFVTEPKILLAAADLTELPEGQRTARLNVLTADGSRADFAGVEVAHVGFLNRERPQDPRDPTVTWRGSRTKDGTVLLDKLGNGRHLLVAALERPERSVFRHTMPPEQVVTERRLREADKWFPTSEKNGTVVDPYHFRGRIGTEGAFEFLVIEVTNDSPDLLTIDDNDVTLTTFRLWDHEAKLLQSGSFDTLGDRVLAPSLLPLVETAGTNWTIPESSKHRLGNPAFGSLVLPKQDDTARLQADPPVRRIVIAPGKTDTLRINWTEWVMRGLWCRRPGKVRESWPSELAPGTIHLRVNLRNRAVILKSLTHPWLVQMRVWDAQRATAAATDEGESPKGTSPSRPDQAQRSSGDRPDAGTPVDDAAGSVATAGTALRLSRPTGTADDDSQQAEDSSIDDLIKALSAEDLNVKAAAVVELGSRKADAAPAAKQLVELLQLKTEHVKADRYTSALNLHAERALQEIGPVTLQALQQGLDHPNCYVRKSCATLIGRFGGESFADTVIKDEAIIARLINMLGEPNDPERGAAGAASSALKSIGVYDNSMKVAVPYVVEPLLKMLTDGQQIPPPHKVWQNNEQPDPEDPLTLPRQRRNYAAGVLGHFAEARAIEPLMAAMESEDRLFRRWAGDALAKMSSPECRKVLAAEQTVLRLIDFLRTDDNWRKNSVTRTLGSVPKEARKPLLAAVDDKDIRVRQAVLQVCRSIRDDNRILPIVLRRMTAEENPDDPIKDRYSERASQLSLLSAHYFELGQRDYRDEVLPLLVEHLKHSDAKVRSSAANAMGAFPKPWLQDDRVMASLIKALKDHTDLYTRQSVIYAMQRLKDERAVLPLIDLLGFDELYNDARVPRVQLTPRDRQRYDEQLLGMLCGTLAELGDKRAIPALRRRNKRNEQNKRNEPPVLEALGKLGDVDSLPKLIAQLKSDSDETQLAAANALQGTPDARSIDALAEALKRGVRGVFTNRNVSQKRRLATAIAKALAATGDPRAAEILIAQSRHGSVWQMDSYGLGRPRDLLTRTDDDPVARPVADMGAVAIPALINELTLTDFAVARVQWVEQQTAKGNQVDKNGIIEYPPKDSPDAFPEYSTASSREVAAWALSQMEVRGHATRKDLKKAETVLIESLLRVDEPGLQFHAGRVLGQLKTKTAIPTLLGVLIASAEKSAEVTDADVEQRERSRGIVFFAPKPETLTIAHFHAAEVADSTARMLSLMGAKTVAVRDAMPPLLTHGVAAVRESVIFATLSSGHSQAVELIMPLLKDPAANVRQAAARQLGFARDKSAVPKLIGLIESEQQLNAPKPLRNTSGFALSSRQRNPSFDVLSMAAQALGMLSGSADADTGDAVFPLTTHADNRLAGHAIMALMQMQDARGIPALRKAMTSDDARLREEVMTRASFLAMYTDGGAGPRITAPDARVILQDRAENDPSSRVRLWGPGALRGVNDEATIKTLVAMCDDEADYIRNDSLRYLLESSHPGRWDMLKRFLIDKAARCRPQAAWHYAELYAGPEDRTDDSADPPKIPEGAPTVAESIALVAPLLSDPDADVREGALRALSRLLPLHEESVPAHIKVIRKLATDDDSAKVRLRASRVLQGIE